ncbi:hypothetical protein E2562_023509, partial [Oryza meyeriana var. granulata]
MLRQTISFLCYMDKSPSSKAAAKWKRLHRGAHPQRQVRRWRPPPQGPKLPNGNRAHGGAKT